ncbi:natural killer cells antigen CD94-like isoform X2 [Alligator sinensis]|uniref:Natural killer cells antigen CD94 n=1 Tax=Alligator sinensis TaxID=38654 RepID=A0A3Q0H9Y2_ALLSI|nr:natural killer cells antigen CD94-like isoform X2 [Alligator sinensis]
MSHGEVTYTDVRFHSSSQERRSQRSQKSEKNQRPQNNESKEMRETEVTYMDVRFHCSSQERRSQRSQNSEKDQRPQNSESKDSPALPTPRRRLITGILGILCLILLVTVVVLVAIRDKNSSCPEKWKPHGHFCYLFTTDWKSWQESKGDCTSLDSKLLDIKNKEELEFSKSQLHVPHWIGLSHQERSESWLWEDGTAFSKDLFAVAQENTSGCCVLLSKVEAKCIPCEEPYPWICKKEAVHPEPAALAEGRKKSL